MVDRVKGSILGHSRWVLSGGLSAVIVVALLGCMKESKAPARPQKSAGGSAPAQSQPCTTGAAPAQSQPSATESAALRNTVEMEEAALHRAEIKTHGEVSNEVIAWRVREYEADGDRRTVAVLLTRVRQPDGKDVWLLTDLVWGFMRDGRTKWETNTVFDFPYQVQEQYDHGPTESEIGTFLRSRSWWGADEPDSGWKTVAKSGQLP